jgi:hypothetical protein
MALKCNAKPVKAVIKITKTIHAPADGRTTLTTGGTDSLPATGQQWPLKG